MYTNSLFQKGGVNISKKIHFTLILALILFISIGAISANEINDNGLVMTDVIVDISKELSLKIEKEKKDKTYDDVNINSNISNWREIFAIYSVVNTNNEKDTIS